MPAKVTIQSGISAGTSHWIEQPVIRIGSDPTCDVCLPSAAVPSHALTLEYRNGQYRVYNRCRSNVFVGTRMIESGKALEWPDTDILQLSDDIELVLDVDADPTPVPMRAAVEPEYEIDEVEADYASPELNYPTDTKTKSDASNTILQVAVIVFCLLGCAGLLARESLKGKSGDRRKAPSFAATIRSANEAKTSPELVQRLQFAESAAVRGNKRSARERFGELRDDLVPQKDKFVEADRKPELAILDFVEYRLGQLD